MTGCTDGLLGNYNGNDGDNIPAFLIDLEVKSVKGNEVTIKTTPSDDETEYCVYIVEKSRYNPSNIPGDAKYISGEKTSRFSNLEVGTDYCVVAAAELLGYLVKEDVTTPGSTGTTDPTDRPDDFVITDIPMKQARSVRRGVSANGMEDRDIELLSKGVAWLYNWSHNIPNFAPAMKKYNMMFLPMVWNAGVNKDALVEFKRQRPEAEYLLAYNEPNLTDQANMTPTTAAAAWPTLKQAASEAGLKIISPALNYGTLPNYGTPWLWMDEFITCDGVSLNDMEAIALHCYMPNVEGMRNMIHTTDKYGKPIYMTEFCHAAPGITNSVESQMNFMSDILNMLETDPSIGGYSWFMTRCGIPAVNLLTTDSNNLQLTDLGRMYVNFSSFDKNCRYTVKEPIPAAHYVAHNLSSLKPSEPWTSTLPVQICNDSYGELMLVCNITDNWVEYQLDIPAGGAEYLALRYNAAMTSTIEIKAGDITETLEFEKSGAWMTKWVKMDIPQGRHTIRVTSKSGRVDLNWLYLE